MKITFLIGLLVSLFNFNLCHALENEPRKLTLQEAILLAVRHNPNVQIAQLDYVLRKYSLNVQEWDFKPHYAIQASHTSSRTYSVTPFGKVTSMVSGVQPAVSLLSPYGTKMILTSMNNVSDNYNPGLSLEVIQPLLRGFGRDIVQAELYNAMDNVKIGRLNVEGELRNTVTNVINAYLDVVSATNNLEIDRQALQRSELSQEQTIKFIKAGHKAGVELVTVKAGVAHLRTRIQNDENILEQSHYDLLTTIGIDPDTPITVAMADLNVLMNKYHALSLAESKHLILEHDIQYQVAQITLLGATTRTLAIARDNQRWKLDLELGAITGNSTGGGRNSGLNSLVNGANNSNRVSLNLNVPIDDVAAKNQVSSAVIALRQSRIALQQEMWEIQKNAINNWNSINSVKQVLTYADEAEKLQKQSYQISSQKYGVGLIDSLELQTAQLDLISSQKDLADTQINYLKSLANMDYLTGTTLKTWHILVNYVC